MTDDELLVDEIYRSIQGETSFAGVPCTLVRLTGCNLRCAYCDTTHAFSGGQRWSRAQVLQRVRELGTPLVLLTGGEPLLQAGALPLLRELCDTGKTVMVETSGERDISPVDPRVHRVVDMKAPSSGESARNCYQNLALLTGRDELKLVLQDRADYEWAKALIAEHEPHTHARCVLLSPVFGVLDPKELVAWTLQDALPVRVQLQLHKLIWGPAARAV